MSTCHWMPGLALGEWSPRPRASGEAQLRAISSHPGRWDTCGPGAPGRDACGSLSRAPRVLCPVYAGLFLRPHPEQQRFQNSHRVPWKKTASSWHCAEAPRTFPGGSPSHWLLLAHVLDGSVCPWSGQWDQGPGGKVDATLTWPLPLAPPSTPTFQVGKSRLRWR